jgi:hypothetical protein
MEDKQKNWLFRFFFSLSLLWAAVVFLLLFDDQYYYNGSNAMELNEVGDFLAGSFSPLAFFWLAYGYWMQNKELSLNRKILHQQIIEFKKSVSISEKSLDHLVKKNRQETLIEIEKSQPVFSVVKLSNIIESSSQDKPDKIWFTLTLNVKNQTAKSIYVLSKNDEMESIGTKNIDDIFSVEIYFEKNDIMVGEKNNSFKLSYNDIRDVNREVDINCTPSFHQVTRYSFNVDIQKIKLVNYEH